MSCGQCVGACACRSRRCFTGPTGSTGPSGGPVGPTGATGPSGGPTGPTGPSGSGNGQDNFISSTAGAQTVFGNGTIAFNGPEILSGITRSGGIFTVAKTGRYLISFDLEMDAVVVPALALVQVDQNGASIGARGTFLVSRQTGFVTELSGSVILNMVAGNTFRLRNADLTSLVLTGGHLSSFLL